jgi:endonuclease/exonuclease/phosphatase family metal-dependent hydrolase
MTSSPGTLKNLLLGGGLLLALGLLLAGCGQSEITAAKSVPTKGNIAVDTDPDDLDGPWTLSGPENLTVQGRGDSTLTSLAPGTYSISWGAVPEWNAPSTRSQVLAAGSTVHFDGIYIREISFDGLVFGTDSTLEVATWNIEHFPKRGAYTVDLAAALVLAMDVDVIALQEIESPGDFADLDERLAGWTGVRASSAGYALNLAFLYRVGGDWVTDGVKEIFTENSREFPRAPYVLEGRFEGVPVVVINNHFKCCGDNFIGSDEWDEEARRRDAGLLLDEYVRTNYADSKVLIVGDMNDSLTDETSRNVFNIFLDAPADWRFVDLGIAQGSSTGWSFPGWPSHLDHILITAGLFSAADDPGAAVSVIPLFEGFQNGWNEYDQNVSDHLPVALKFVP